MLQTELYNKHFVQIWERSPNSFPLLKRRYTFVEQLTREKNFEQLQSEIKLLQSKATVKNLKGKDPGSTFFPIFRSFLDNVFDFDKQQLEIILSDKFKDVSKEFFYRARKFDQNLSPENIYQAMRNVWIMNGIQLMMDLPVEITPSVFAYSMIYPYSDNLLDGATVSDEDKRTFSQSFNLRLHGEKIKAKNHTETQLFRLVSMIEEQYPREDFPKVYESLYAIQRGQTNSLKLMQPNGLKTSDIQEICFEKGGASVLADGYLVAGELTAEQERALFGYGVYLQLLDDIQDVKEDLNSHSRTMFSCAPNNFIDEYVNQTIHFGRIALKEMTCFINTLIPRFLELMNQSIETMIIESVGLEPESFSESWLQQIEKYSPLRFDFIRKKQDQNRSQRFTIFKKYFYQAQPEPARY